MKNITAEELKSRLESGEKPFILDVREPAEYAEFNIGGTLIPLGKIVNMQIDEIDEMRDQEIIIHCKGGTRSLQACMVLEQMGFSNVVNMVGGVLAWQKLP
jgi:rhodanese-related sulfurtransferase